MHFVSKGILVICLLGLASAAFSQQAPNCPSGPAKTVYSLCTRIIYNQSATPGWKVVFTGSTGSVQYSVNDLPVGGGEKSSYSVTHIRYCGKCGAMGLVCDALGKVTVTDPAGHSVVREYVNKSNACPVIKNQGCTGAVAFNKFPGGTANGDITIGPFSSFKEAEDKGEKCWSL